MILLTGVTGNIGGEILRTFVENRIPARVLARNPDKLKGATGDFIEIRPGDLSDSASLDSALAGVDTAFLLPPVDPRAIEIHSIFIDAARRAKVGRIVKLSAMGANSNAAMTFGRWHGEGERLLEESGIPFTHLRPNVFMQNLLGAAPMIAHGAIFQPAGDAKVSFVDVRDIAAVAFAALTEPGHERKIYEITGPEALSYEDIATIFSETLGKPVAYHPISPEEARQGLAAAGLEEWRIRAILELFEENKKGFAATVTSVVRDIAKKPPIAFREFARDYSGAFQS